MTFFGQARQETLRDERMLPVSLIRKKFGMLHIADGNLRPYGGKAGVTESL